MTAVWQSDNMASNKEMKMKRGHAIKFLYEEKVAPTGTRGCMLTIDGDQTVHKNTVRQ